MSNFDIAKNLNNRKWKEKCTTINIKSMVHTKKIQSTYLSLSIFLYTIIKYFSAKKTICFVINHLIVLGFIQCKIQDGPTLTTIVCL